MSHAFGDGFPAWAEFTELAAGTLAWYGARFPTEIHTRGCHWDPTHVRLKLEANMCVTNGIPLGGPLLLPFGTANYVATLKGSRPVLQGSLRCILTMDSVTTLMTSLH
jgi:hypothetical protein